MRVVSSTQAASTHVWRLVALALLAVSQLFDYVSFMVMVERHGLGAELNPIVVTLHQSVGLVGLTVVKAAAVVFLASTATLLMPRRPRIAYGVLVIGILLGIAGGISNVLTL